MADLAYAYRIIAITFQMMKHRFGMFTFRLVRQADMASLVRQIRFVPRQHAGQHTRP